MSWDLLFQSAVISAITSGIISFLAYRSQKKIDFIYSYRSYILEKRKEAYNHIEPVLTELKQTRDFGGGVITHAFIGEWDGENPILSFNYKVLKCMTSQYWLSDEAAIWIEKLNLLLTQMLNECNQRKAGPIEVVDIGHKAFEALSHLEAQLSLTYFKDICELDDIRKFKLKVKV